jgi:hypothetical protein
LSIQPDNASINLKNSSCHLLTFDQSEGRAYDIPMSNGEEVFPFVSDRSGTTSFSKSHCLQVALHQSPPLPPSYQLMCLEVLSLSGFKLCLASWLSFASASLVRGPRTLQDVSPSGWSHGSRVCGTSFNA